MSEKLYGGGRQAGRDSAMWEIFRANCRKGESAIFLSPDFVAVDSKTWYKLHPHASNTMEYTVYDETGELPDDKV